MHHGLDNQNAVHVQRARQFGLASDGSTEHCPRTAITVAAHVLADEDTTVIPRVSLAVQHFPAFVRRVRSARPPILLGVPKTEMTRLRGKFERPAINLA